MNKYSGRHRLVRGPLVGLILLLSVLGSVLAGITLTAYAASAVVLDNWKISSGKVKIVAAENNASGNRIAGTFKLESTLREPGTRRAGACLLADLTGQGVGLESCQTHQQCNDAYQAAPHPKLGTTDPHLYCLSERASKGSKQCWIRPGPSETYCRKEIFAPGTYELPKVEANVPNSGSAPANPLGGDKAVWWLVYTCLNPENGNPPPCTNPESPAKVNSIGAAGKVKP